MDFSNIHLVVADKYVCVLCTYPKSASVIFARAKVFVLALRHNPKRALYIYVLICRWSREYTYICYAWNVKVKREKHVEQNMLLHKIYDQDEVFCIWSFMVSKIIIFEYV